MGKRKELQPREVFMIRFKEIKQYCDRKPRNVKRCYQDSTKFQEIVRHLDYVLVPKIERDMAIASRKEMPHSIDGFAEQWEEYQKKWANEITLAWQTPENEQWLTEMIAQESSERETSGYPIREATEDDFLFDEADYELDESFDPVKHNPAPLFKTGVEYLYECFYGSEELLDEPTISNMVHMSDDALSYFEKVIGIDFDGIARRWKKTPYFYIPKHISDWYGQTERNSLYDLLHEAYKAYVFGLFVPCIVMCRALTEEVVKNHYPPTHGEDPDNLSLMQLMKSRIENDLLRKRLGSLIDKANTLLHASDRLKRISRKDRKSEVALDEKEVLDYLRIVKLLIEKSPTRSK